MSDIDDLVRRTTAYVTNVADKVGGFAGKIFIIAAGICGLSFYLGVEALSGGIETVWIVLGLFFGAIALGGPLVALWRVGSARRHIGDIQREVRTLAEEGGDPSNTVVETIIVGDPENDPNAGSAIVLSRQMGGFQTSFGSDLAKAPHLADATKALAAFPFQILVTIGITAVFAFLALIFALALAL
jgi:hypothetical protein